MGGYIVEVKSDTKSDFIQPYSNSMVIWKNYNKYSMKIEKIYQGPKNFNCVKNGMSAKNGMNLSKISPKS